ncbi:Rv2175c family DNA-binding protein [Flaviflexus massiliensis]|uniref:Rv2175c family DNA-binding protein n=1 Tax=Flaviflexus massiliensis TaxID=1522309 RepID=UPI001E28AF01|nr:Rv2175c family DNA-binding protein [Flaviflexus massiliensis]
MNSVLPDNMSLPEVAVALNIRLRDVRTLISEHKLLATRPEGPLVVTSDQLVEEDGTWQVLGNLRGTLILLSDSGFSDDEAHEWLHREDAELGMTPMEALRQGKHRAVRRIASGLAY